MTLTTAYLILIFVLILSFIIGGIVHNLNIIDESFKLKILAENMSRTFTNFTKTFEITKKDEIIEENNIPQIIQTIVVEER